MTSFIVKSIDGQQKSISITEGMSLMEQLRDNGYDEIQALCGGCCSCATCHVHVESSPVELPPIEDGEAALLEMVENYHPEKSRLSCQISLSDDLNGLQVQIVDID